MRRDTGPAGPAGPAGLAALAGLDEVDWPGLEHAYGSAEDTPGLLRALLSADADEVSEAVSDLYGSICHQGSVYSATPYAVPFLARLCAAGVRPRNLLGLLGHIAESDDERGCAAGAARAAVAEQTSVLLPLIDAPEPAVRTVAIWALAQCRRQEPLTEVLREHWSRERDPEVRATLLMACSTLDPAGTADLTAAALVSTEGAESAEVRLVAALARLRAGGSWHPALVADPPRADVLKSWVWSEHPFQDLLEELMDRGLEDTAFDLLERALARSRDDVRVLWIPGHLAGCFRTALPRALALLIPLLSVEVQAVRTVRDLGAAAAPAADTLARVADEADGDHADQALAALIELNDPRAVPLLARDLAARPWALSAVTGGRTDLPMPALPFDPVLLAAVRDRLKAIRRGGQHSRAPGGGNERIRLALLLGRWGPAAAPAAPELRAHLPHAVVAVSKALAGIGPRALSPDETKKVVAALTKASKGGPVIDRLAAARALHGFTGDDRRLRTAIEDGLAATGHGRWRAAQAASDLGENARPLLTALRRAMEANSGPSRTTPEMDARVEAARVVWRLTGDSGAVLPVLAAGLHWSRPIAGAWTAVHAAEVAAELGPAGAPLTAGLRAMLEAPRQAPAAARALLSVTGARLSGDASATASGETSAEVSEDVSAVVAPLLAALADDNLHLLNSQIVMDAIAMLAEVGAARPGTEVAERLHRLASGNRRVFGPDAGNGAVPADERLCARIGRILGRLDDA